jgi:ABC-type oligopeptide transport system substrate-binding subunit
MRRISAAAVLLAMISLLTGAPSAGAQDSSGEDEKLVFRVGSTNDIDGFNPFKIVEIPSYEVMGLTYDLLVDLLPKTRARYLAWQTPGKLPKTASPGPSTSTRTPSGTTANP